MVIFTSDSFKITFGNILINKENPNNNFFFTSTNMKKIELEKLLFAFNI